MSISKDIVTYLNTNRQPMLDYLAQLVLAESPSTHPEAQVVPQTMLLESLRDLDFDVQLLPGQRSGGQLLARSGNGSQPQQLLLGHCDTVWPLGTLKTMPFEIEDNIVRGPGVYDMKGGLTQIIFALKALQALQLSPKVAPIVVINSDEEIGSHDSRSVIEAWAQRAQRTFVLEPALGLSGKLKTARKGVGHFDVVVNGRAAHAGLDPEKGTSAVLALSMLVQQLFALNDLENGVSVNVGTITGGLRANVIAPKAHAVVDVRVPSLADAQRMEAVILNLQAPLLGTTLEITGKFDRPPMERTSQNQALWHTAVACGASFGLDLEEGTSGGGSDGNFTSLYTATLDGLGPVGDGAHARHEFIYIDNLIERTALLTLLLLSP